jgi:hypothetical protein
LSFTQDIMRVVMSSQMVCAGNYLSKTISFKIFLTFSTDEMANWNTNYVSLNTVTQWNMSEPKPV